MDFSILMKEECCSADLKVSGKDEALRRFAHLAKQSPVLDEISEEHLYEKLKTREEQGSTGFGDGIALPHARIDGIKEFVLFIVTFKKGIDFDASDKKKCRLFFVMFGPVGQVTEHVKILAALSRTIASHWVREELLKAPSPQALYESFLRHTDLPAEPSGEQRKMKLLYVILYLEELMYDIMEYFLQSGIDGATVIDSSGMGEYISIVPMFAEFIGFMQEKKNRSKTIIALIPEEKLTTIVQGIEKITGDLTTKQGAMIIAVDAVYYKGSMTMM